MTSSRISRLQLRKTMFRHAAGALALCFGPLAVGACSSSSASDTTQTGIVLQAVQGADCGFTLTSRVDGVGQKGFNVQVDVTNVSGETSLGFSVLVQAGQAQLVNSAHGSFQTTDNGYLLSPVDSIANSQLEPGQTYSFELKFEGTYTEFTPIIMSSNGAYCDQTAPNVNLSESSNFFGASGTLNLTAQASDNVAVAKVVFLQDGVPIGVVTSAPYTLGVPVNSTLNGRRVYSAVAYDLAGNSASQVAGRVLVAIGNKFFGMASAYEQDYAQFLSYFNQITPGNAGKWGSVEATRGTMVWTELDRAYNFAKANDIPFKLHTLVWGQQQPTWMAGLSGDEQRAEIKQWFEALAAKYSGADMIDVVNEPLRSAPPSYKEALGGDGATGWDWVIKAFEMAREYFPNSELILNEYSVIQDTQTTESFMNLVNLLKARGLIDGIGEQGHFYERWPTLDVLSANLNTLAATGLPIYISEFDVSDPNDSCQAARLGELFKMFWQNPSVVGVTHWGYLKGLMWRTDGWLVDGTTPRQSLNWIQSYQAGGTSTPVTCVPLHEGNSAEMTLQPELYDAVSSARPVGDAIGYANDGAWFSFQNVVFRNSWNKVSLSYAKGADYPVTMTIHLDSLANPPVATIPLGNSGGWWTFRSAESSWASTSGTHDVYVRYNGGGANVENVKFFFFGANLLPDSNFENGLDGWYATNASAQVAGDWYHGTAGQSLKGVGSGSGYPNLWRDIKTLVQPGKKYQASVWVSGGAGGNWIGFRGQQNCATAGWKDYEFQPGGWVNGNSWKQISGIVDFTQCTSAVWWAQIYVGAGSGTYYVDDVQLTELL